MPRRGFRLVPAHRRARAAARLATTPVLLVLGVAAVIGLGVLVLRGVRSPTPSAAPTAVAAPLIRLTATGGPGFGLGDGKGGIVVTVGVRNNGTEPVTVIAESALPDGFTAALPRDGISIAPGATGRVPLHWAGPDCSATLPDQILATFHVNAVGDDGSRYEVDLETPSVNDQLLQTWAVTCATQTDQPLLGS